MKDKIRKKLAVAFRKSASMSDSERREALALDEIQMKVKAVGLDWNEFEAHADKIGASYFYCYDYYLAFAELPTCVISRALWPLLVRNELTGKLSLNN